MAIPVGRSAKTERSLAENVALAAMLGYALAAIEMQAVVFHSLVPPIGIISLVAAPVVIGPKGIPEASTKPRYGCSTSAIGNQSTSCMSTTSATAGSTWSNSNVG